MVFVAALAMLAFAVMTPKAVTIIIAFSSLDVFVDFISIPTLHELLLGAYGGIITLEALRNLD